LVDCLLVVIARLVRHAHLPEQIPSDFEGGREGIDGIEVRTERLLGLFHRCIRGMQGFIEIALCAQGVNPFAKERHKGVGGRIHGEYG